MAAENATLAASLKPLRTRSKPPDLNQTCCKKFFQPVHLSFHSFALFVPELLGFKFVNASFLKLIGKTLLYFLPKIIFVNYQSFCANVL
jgi:hypothetical protein